MAIVFHCECGKRYSVDEKFAGKSTTCKACSAALLIPAEQAVNRPPQAASAASRPAPTESTPKPLPAASIPVPPTGVQPNIKTTASSSSANAPHTPGTRKKNDTMAVVSLFLGLSSFCMVFLTGVPAIILGILSLKRIGNSRGQLSGTGHAIGGIASGAFGIILSLAFLPLIFVVREKAALVHSAHNMRTLTLAVLSYEETNQRWPDSIDELDSFCKGNGGLSVLLNNPVTADDPRL